MYKKLKAMRYKNKYTTKQMSEMLGISKPFYCQIENRTRRLSYDRLLELLKSLKFTQIIYFIKTIKVNNLKKVFVNPFENEIIVIN